MGKYTVWFSNYIIKLIRRKPYHCRKWKQSIGDATYHYDKFKEIRAITKREITPAYKTYLHN